ncbi:MAG: hypothetical protein JSW04_13955, partial [Desulfobacterales bacterium]
MIEVKGYHSLKCFYTALLLLLLHGAFASSFADNVVPFYCNYCLVCDSGKVDQDYILNINPGQDLRLAQADIFDGLLEEEAAGKTTSTVEGT